MSANLLTPPVTTWFSFTGDSFSLGKPWKAIKKLNCFWVTSSSSPWGFNNDFSFASAGAEARPPKVLPSITPKPPQGQQGHPQQLWKPGPPRSQVLAALVDLRQRDDVPEVRERCPTGPHCHPRAALRAGVSPGASPWLCVTQRCLGQTLCVPEGFSLTSHYPLWHMEQSRHPSDTPNSPQSPEGQSVTTGMRRKAPWAAQANGSGSNILT